jgi:hypothetical protein
VAKFVDESLLITAPSTRDWQVDFPLFAFTEDVGNEIDLDDFYVPSPYDSMEVHLQSVSFDPMTFKATLKGYYIWGGGELAS